MYVVFKFKGGEEKIRQLYQDDLVGRQSIVRREGKSLGFEEALYVIVEGSEEAIHRAREIAGDYLIQGDEAEKIYKKIKEEEDSASIGMGVIFG